MNIQELKEILEATGIPVAYSHFTESENNPLPETPFICYLVTGSASFAADNKTYYSMPIVDIELYTDLKDLEIESRVETVLKNYELPFSTTETFIDSEQMYQKIYEVRLF